MKKSFAYLKSLLKLFRLHKIWLFWKQLIASWHIYLEQPIPVQELTHSREAASIPSFGFFLLMISSTVIATLGLLENSTGVIIGAMIIAPLMNPILSMSFSIVTGNWKLYKRSLITVFLGVSSAILVSYFISVLLPINIVGSEIVSRTSPDLLDLGIAIAAGTVGAFSLTRQSVASSIAGVAIAVALVPPLCVVGIGLGIGNDLAAEFGQVLVNNFGVSSGAFLLFLANLTGITFTACLVFLFQSYGNLQKAFQSILIWVFMIALLCGPLSDSLRVLFITNRINSEIYQLRTDHPQVSQMTQIRYVGVRLENKTAYITVLLNAPKDSLTDAYLESGSQRISNSLSNMGIISTEVVIRIIPVDISEYKLIISQ